MTSSVDSDGSTPPIFARVAIVGAGLIGGSLGLAIRARWPESHVMAIDRRDVVSAAIGKGVADTGGEHIGLAAEADLIVLAAPVGASIDRLRELGASIVRPVVVTDVGSTKRAICAAAADLPPHVTFVGGHPFAGAAWGGIEHARADLFATRPWFLVPEGVPEGGHSHFRRPPKGDTHTSAAPGRGTLTLPAAEATRQLTAFVTALGAIPVLVDAEEHDRFAASVSHLPQFAVSALLAVVGDEAGEAGLRLAGRGLIDTTRLASSPAGIWRDIAATNADYIDAALGQLIARLAALRADLRTGRVLDDTFASAARWRATLVE